MLDLGLDNRKKRAMALLFIAAGGSGLQFVRGILRQSLKEQQLLCSGLERRTSSKKSSPKVQVDAVFAARLGKIIKICVPSPFCFEAGLIAAQTALLVGRTFITEYIARLEGRAGQYIIARDTTRVTHIFRMFVAVAAPAALVNSGLKYLQKRIKLAFMRRLSLHLHTLYCSHRAYYAATTLGGLTFADQRLTEDVEKFAFAISELYSYTFKPALDVALFTRSLAKIMGYKGQAMLYGYYVGCALLLRATSPPLALMTTQETALAGSFRGAHQRLATHSEEIAFNDPPAGMAEQMILNQHLYRLLRHARLSALLQFFQGVLDGYFVKYGATVVALAVYASHVGTTELVEGGQATSKYIQAMRLLSNTSRGIADLVLVYKRVTGLAGHTSRVSELLEQVAALAGEGGVASERVHAQLYLRNVSSSGTLAMPPAPDGSLLPPPEPRRREGDIVSLKRVYLSAPDGTPLVREMSFDVTPGVSVLIMGPNGSGKSSLFRVAAGLWPLQAGEVTLPPKGELFYLSQRPYLVAGTLRDQLLYPEPPRSVLSTASERARERIAPWIRSRLMNEEELEERLCACLEAVELDYLLGRGKGWDQMQPWEETLSGGEKQRLAMARLLFHAPRYAILDEATSAVSADGERILYQQCVKAGITMLSIGHRPALREFHSLALHFEGQTSGKGWHIEQLRSHDRAG